MSQKSLATTISSYTKGKPKKHWIPALKIPRKGDRYIPIAQEDNMKDWIDSIEARTKAQKKYDKEHTKGISKGIYIKLNLRTDVDIIRWFWKQPSKQGAIKRLIREETARENP